MEKYSFCAYLNLLIFLYNSLAELCSRLKIKKGGPFSAMLLISEIELKWNT
jgi:hypothetical protein